MTREEAIKVLKRMKYPYNCKAQKLIISNVERDNKALDMAIQALSQEQDMTIAYLMGKYEDKEPCDDIAQERYKDLCEYFGDAKDILKNREDFKAWLDRIKWHIHKAEELSAENDDLRDQLAMRDRFQKQEPTGHWIRISPAEIYECSECGQNVMTGDIGAYKFCHGCGARMESEEQTE